MEQEHFDVLIVGAGLSGIGAGYHLQAKCPGKSYAILEARACIGGTWDLFRYPGIRSDSDMYTLGYSFRPWTQPEAIADGPAILRYVRETAAEYGIDKKIRFDTKVTRAEWSTQEARWTVEIETGATRERTYLTCNFLFMCSGYYQYEAGYTPAFAGVERFAGRIAHPQQWADDIAYAGKRVVVIGSGATAVTLVPEMAKTAGHVTMLQRSPTYVVSRPRRDGFANWLRRVLPSRMAYGVARWKNVLLGMLLFRLCKRYPDRIRKMILAGVTKQLGASYDVNTHFTPHYKPWDQRLCLAPDGDLFKAIRKGRVAVVTERIETFTERGIALCSGAELEADVIVTATGLNLQVMGGARIAVDGRDVDLAQTMNYKGMMYSDIPNLASAFGYTNASWTLKCDLTCEYICRVLNYMDRHGYRQCTPHNDDPTITAEPRIDFSSGYVQRSIDQLPKQGSKAPWRLYQNYALDIVSLKFGSIEDDAIAFAK